MFRRRPTQIQLEPDEVRNHIDHFNRQVEKARENALKEQKAQKLAKQQLHAEDDASSFSKQQQGQQQQQQQQLQPNSPDPMHDITLEHDEALERILLRHERIGIMGNRTGGVGGSSGTTGGAQRSLLETPPRPGPR